MIAKNDRCILRCNSDEDTFLVQWPQASKVWKALIAAINEQRSLDGSRKSQKRHYESLMALLKLGEHIMIFRYFTFNFTN